MKRILGVFAAVAVGTFAFAGAVEGATPSSGSVSPTSPTTTWNGHFYAAAGNVGGATGDVTPCTSATLDPTDSICDHFTVTVGVDSTYWSTNGGGLSVTIAWADPGNDFDLFVYDSAGNQVGASAQGGTTSEQAFIPRAAGTYEVRVVPFLV